MTEFSIPEPEKFTELLSLKNKVAIVTGGSRGIGKQIVKRLSEAGATVVFTARGKDALQQTQEEITAAGGNVVGVQADSSKIQDSKRVVDYTVEKFGAVDILVNCAAVFPMKNAMDMDEKTWDQTFAIDTKGAFFFAKLAAEKMIAAGNGGRIINILSTAANKPLSSLIAYGAAKSALWYVTQALAQELGQNGIVVNAVTPGGTMTEERLAALKGGDMGDLAQSFAGSDSANGSDGPDFNTILNKLPQMIKSMMPLGRLGFPDDIAKAVLFLASDMGQYISGVNITVDGGQSLADPKSSMMQKIQDSSKN
ncbi:SDR family NAD(P)-dependent oxidoreductase [Bombilactobacillus thymidiniphilus]|uniref:SDR family oxidoreductase n=1 Tax=Bombilactobacillus thymidiniphilus TaxID=2923363 RepID=A0ABY4PBI6_9LACO|nr:SDR family oxidoreductase [Bombilactobacillus thymidiniphilus]UQS83119.1 SDR family oxidoreductase [Bombilactobacillus thymidiniphilus]